jgi:hypothetical protein
MEPFSALFCCATALCRCGRDAAGRVRGHPVHLNRNQVRFVVSQQPLQFHSFATVFLFREFTTAGRGSGVYSLLALEVPSRSFNAGQSAEQFKQVAQPADGSCRGSSAPYCEHVDLLILHVKAEL